MAGGSLLLLDGHSLAYRAFYGLPVENFNTSTGQPTNAVYGFTSMLVNLLRDEHPSHVAVAFDVSRKSFRTDKFEDYKATRSASPAEFKGQVELIKDVVAAFAITVLDAPGFEADDIIATLAAQSSREDLDVAIVSGDRDTFQLVSEQVTVLYPRKGVSDLARMTPASVEEKYGITPEQYADFAALRGDPSDNLPGIPGVGEKTAVKWLRAYGSLAGVVEHAAEIPGKVGDALRDALPQVLLNRELTQLVQDVPLPVGPSGLRWEDWSLADVDRIFDALQFTAMRTRARALRGDETAKSNHPSASNDNSAPSGLSSSVDFRFLAVGEAQPFFSSVETAALAFEERRWPGRAEISTTGARTSDQTVVCSLEEPSDRSSVEAWLADPSRTKILHDAKALHLALLTATDGEKVVTGVSLDTTLAAYVENPSAQSYALSDLVSRYLGEVLTEGEVEGGQLRLQTGDETDWSALAQAANAIEALADVLQSKLSEDGLDSLLLEIEIPLAALLARMEFAGIAVDQDKLRRLSADFEARMRAAETSAHEIVGRPFNIASPKQLQEVLFVERGLPKTKKIKTGYTTEAEALHSLHERTNDPVLEQILAWRDVSKLRQVVESLLPLVDDSGRIHTTFKQTVAATGRLSSSDPNLQNIPIRSDEGRRIRECFVVGAEYECLLTADYSQIEMRIMAHLANDPGLIEAFIEGEDLHSSVAAQVFQVPESTVDAEMRRRIKAMSYGLAYGLSAYGLSQQLRISPDESQRLMDDYFTRFGGVRDYLTSVVEQARKTGYTETLRGRRRYLPDLAHSNRVRREMAERMALNAPIQGSAADIVKIAMLRVEEALVGHNLKSRVLLQVHDELVLEIAPGELAHATEVVTTAMTSAADLRVPLEVSVGTGRDWASAAH